HPSAPAIHDRPTPNTYPLSLHDALPISAAGTLSVIIPYTREPNSFTGRDTTFTREFPPYRSGQRSCWTRRSASCECGGWDLNPRTPTGQGPEPCAFDLSWQPPRERETGI